MKGIYPFGANIYQKLPILAIFRAASLHLESQSGKIWREGAYLGLPPPSQILYKFFKTNLYQRLPIAAILQVVSTAAIPT